MSLHTEVLTSNLYEISVVRDSSVCFSTRLYLFQNYEIIRKMKKIIKEELQAQIYK